MKCECGSMLYYESGQYLKCKRCDRILEDKDGYGY